MDGSKYSSSQQNMIVFTDPNAYFNDVPVSFGPALFDVLNAMSDAVGEMAFIVGLSMRFPDDFQNVIELAAASVGKLGNRLDSMLLGNVRVSHRILQSRKLTRTCRSQTFTVDTAKGMNTK